MFTLLQWCCHVASSIVGYRPKCTSGRRPSVFEIRSSEDASIRMDQRILGFLNEELAVRLLWSILWRKFCPVDVYSKALSIQCGIPDDKFELCVRFVGGSRLLP